MDLATLIKPILTAGQLRVVGSTTHEEFKHIEKDRALARRLQKITVDEPSIQETVKILQGLRSRYEAHHRVKYTDEALEAAAKLAARHLRDYQLPDSAIDVLDEAGATPAPGARRRARRPGRAPIIDEITRAADRRSDRADGAHPGEAGVLLRPGPAADARGIARPRRLRPGRGGPDRGARHQALARRPRPAGSSGRLLPVHRPDRRRQDRARQTARDASRQRVHALRHERVHGEARGGAADRRAAGLRRASSRAGCSSTPCASIRTRCCSSTRSRRRTRTSSTSCCR